MNIINIPVQFSFTPQPEKKPVDMTPHCHKLYQNKFGLVEISVHYALQMGLDPHELKPIEVSILEQRASETDAWSPNCLTTGHFNITYHTSHTLIEPRKSITHDITLGFEYELSSMIRQVVIENGYEEAWVVDFQVEFSELLSSENLIHVMLRCSEFCYTAQIHTQGRTDNSNGDSWVGGFIEPQDILPVPKTQVMYDLIEAIVQTQYEGIELF